MFGQQEAYFVLCLLSFSRFAYGNRRYVTERERDVMIHVTTHNGP
jgi:hypothetical protein